MRKTLLAIAAALALAQPAAAQITPTYTFTAGTVANPDEVNANFALLGNALNRTGGTMTGTLNSRSVIPTAANTYDLGSVASPFQSVVLRTSAVLVQAAGNYTLTWANPAAARAISIADPGGTDVFTFNAAAQTLTNKTITAPVLTGTATGAYTMGGTGVWNAGAVTSSGNVSDSGGTMAAIRTGGVAIASQAALDFVYASSASQLARLAASGLALQSPRINAAGNAWEMAASTIPFLDMAGGRLTLESGVAVSTSDQSAKTTLYYTPYAHNVISLYNGSSWDAITFSELSISLAGLTASKPYDVFCYNNAGTATLEMLVWTSTTARATALVKQDGRWVKTGALTRRYLGTVYINSTGGQTDDTYAKRYVWNANNRVSRPMRVLDATNSWAYSTATIRQANASTANQLDFVVGLPDVKVNGRVSHTAAGSAGNLRYYTGIGLDSTTTNATGCLIDVGVTVSTQQGSAHATLATYPGIGRHTLVWLETAGPDGGTLTWYGTSGGSNMQSGIDGWIEG